MKRLQTLGLFATLLAVAVLTGSLVAGLGGEETEESTVATEPGETAPAERVQIEVLNAAGVPGLARTATRILRREREFDVVYFGNAESFGGDSSVAIDRVGDPEAAQRVADALGIRHVESQPDSTIYLDVSVILGRDWRGHRAEILPGLELPARRDSL